MAGPWRKLLYKKIGIIDMINRSLIARFTRRMLAGVSNFFELRKNDEKVFKWSKVFNVK